MPDETSAKILWIVPRMIWPPVSGGEIRVLGLMRRLASRFRLFLAAPASASEKARGEATAMLLEREGIEKVFLFQRPIEKTLRWKDRLKPLIVQDFFDVAIERRLKTILQEIRPDLVQLEFSEMGQFADLARRFAPVILTEHDSGFLSRDRHYQRPERGRFPGDPFLQWLLRCAHEWKVFRKCDRIVALSPADAEIFSRWTSPEKIRVVATGVETARFPFIGPEERIQGRIAFLGFYPHYPNEEAAVRLSTRIFPAIQEKIPDATLQLLGSYPSPRVLGLRRPGIEIPGTVPEIHPLLSKASAFVSPVRLGRGIKGKILEAFASGTPVIATPESCEALAGVDPERHLLIGKDDADLARQTIRLLEDSDLSSRLARNARAYVESGWDASKKAEDMARVYDELL